VFDYETVIGIINIRYWSCNPAQIQWNAWAKCCCTFVLVSIASSRLWPTCSATDAHHWEWLRSIRFNSGSQILKDEHCSKLSLWECEV